VKTDTNESFKPFKPCLSVSELATYRLVLAARAFSSAKSDMEEYVAGQDLMRAAVEYGRCVSDDALRELKL
jgi:hypothetical protein